MKRVYVAIFGLAAFAMVFPISSNAAKVSSTPVCDAAFAPDAIRIAATQHLRIKAGARLDIPVTITNLTQTPVSGVRFIMKVFHAETNDLTDRYGGWSSRMAQLEIMPGTYALPASGSATTTFAWTPSLSLTDGVYRLEFYATMNSGHVTGTFRHDNDATRISRVVVRVDSQATPMPLSFEREKTLVSGKPYILAEHMPVFSANDPAALTAFVKNVSSSSISATVTWNVFVDSPSVDEEQALSVPTQITVPGRGDVSVALPVPTKPGWHYYGTADLNYNGQHELLPLRFGRLVSIPAGIRFVGIYNPANASDTLAVLKKGTEYRAFACVDGETNAPEDDLSVTVKDENGAMLLSSKEQLTVGEFAQYEYSFTPKNDISHVNLEVISKTVLGSEKATLDFACGNSPMGCPVERKSHSRLILLVALLVGVSGFGIWDIKKRYQKHLHHG